jgi:hypothetical protein
VAGDLVPWDDLNEAERAYHFTPPPWVAVEFGMSVAEYCTKFWSDVALHELFLEDDSFIPGAP